MDRLKREDIYFKILQIVATCKDFPTNYPAGIESKMQWWEKEKKLDKQAC